MRFYGKYPLGSIPLITHPHSGDVSALLSRSDVMKQRRWNHKVINVLDRLPKHRQEQAKQTLHGGFAV